ncbi:MAG: DUF3365 domain-containing protein [Elusimicrobia bacterium]|nr:DUF3365 domain-containing protein [Elusimicrobiota bacterium]
MKRIFLLVPLAWTLFILSLAGLSVWNSRSSAERVAVAHARETLDKDLTYRLWVTGHGGVYVPVSANTPPNPYLADIPERDIVTPSGKKLTLLNPAYMTRQVHELGRRQYGLRGHITSLNPIRPENAADDWERKALLAFADGAQEASSHETIGGQKFFRLMRPLVTEAGCLKCHAQQGYKAGDIRGGISVAVPWEHMQGELTRSLWVTIAAFAAIWALGLCGLWLSWKVITRQVFELQSALNEVKTLSGLIPICASCKKVRNDKGFWQSVEKYFAAHTDAKFSHGICPDCGHRLYGEFYEETPPE